MGIKRVLFSPSSHLIPHRIHSLTNDARAGPQSPYIYTLLYIFFQRKSQIRSSSRSRNLGPSSLVLTSLTLSQVCQYVKGFCLGSQFDRGPCHHPRRAPVHFEPGRNANHDAGFPRSSNSCRTRRTVLGTAKQTVFSAWRTQCYIRSQLPQTPSHTSSFTRSLSAFSCPTT